MSRETVSRSQKKREAKAVEDLAFELADLSPQHFKAAPLDEDLRLEVDRARKISANSARKRQIKLVAKYMREMDLEPIVEFIREVKGLKFEQTQAFQQVERLKNLILSEEESENGIREALERFPGLDEPALTSLAEQHRRTGNRRFSREIFRMLKAAYEREQWRRKRPENQGGEES